MFDTDLSMPTDMQHECTIFNGVTYLGAAKVNAPKSESELQRNMSILNAEQGLKMGIKVSVSIPSSSQGSVVYVENFTRPSAISCMYTELQFRLPVCTTQQRNRR